MEVCIYVNEQLVLYHIINVCFNSLSSTEESRSCFRTLQVSGFKYACNVKDCMDPAGNCVLRLGAIKHLVGLQSISNQSCIFKQGCLSGCVRR